MQEFNNIILNEPVKNETTVFQNPNDLEKDYDELISEIDWKDPESLAKAMKLISLKINPKEEIQTEKRLMNQGKIEICDNAKKLLEGLAKLIDEIHCKMRADQTERFDKMREEIAQEIKSHLNLSSMSAKMKRKYMEKETKYSLFKSNYTPYLQIIYKRMYELAKEYGQFFNDSQMILKNKDRMKEKISRHSYYSLKTGKMESSKDFYIPEIEYGEPTLMEGLNGYMELGGKAIEFVKQSTTNIHKTEMEKREKLVRDINEHEEFTRKLIEEFDLIDYAKGKDLDKSHDWSVKNSQLLVYRDLESWFNDLIIYQELSLGVGEVLKYQYIKNYESNKKDIERFIYEQKMGMNDMMVNNPNLYGKIERYISRAKLDPYIGGVIEGLVVEELNEPKYPCCLAKKLGSSDWSIVMRLSESTWQVDKRRIQFKLINTRTKQISRTYMVKFSDIEKKIFDIDSLLNMMISIPIDSFAYLMLQNYVLKPTDEKETWLGLDHFMSTPLNLKTQFTKTKELLQNDKYPVHRNTSDVEFFILSIVTNAQKCMEFNHLGVIFKPRKRQGNVKQLVECFEAFGLKRCDKPERRYIKFLIRQIRSGYYDEDFNFDGISRELNSMNEVTAEQLMGTSSSNHMEIKKYFTSEYASTLVASGRYHSMKTAETVAELLKDDFSHLKLNEILGKLTQSCLVRIFIKEMMGGMRDIAILSPQWKVACAILEELAKRVSMNSEHDLIQKEKQKAQIITEKIKKLEKRFIDSHHCQGRLIVLEMDYKKWNAHQWTEILGEITSELINRSYKYRTSGGEYVKVTSEAYNSKMMQVEIKRLGSAVYAHLAMIEDKSLLSCLNLTEEERKCIEKMNANPMLARQEYTGDVMQNWIEDGLKSVKETGNGKDKINLQEMILMVRCPHGMGQGIFSTQSSIYGTIVLKPILDALMKAFNVNFYDYVETSDDGNVYMMVPKNHKLIQPAYQNVFVEELNNQVKEFGLELSVGKVKWDINGSFCFNSSDYDTNSIEYHSGLPAKVECLNRLWKGFGSLQYESPFMQYLRNSTWLIFLKNAYKINQKDMSQIAKWMKTVRDRVLRNVIVLDGLTAEQTEFLYCTVPSVEVNGEIFFTNRKEVEMLMAMAAQDKKSIDLNFVKDLMRPSESAIGFTFKNPSFDVQRKFSDSKDLLIARESGFDGQVKMLSHLTKMKGSCETFASYFRVICSPWIEKDGMKVQLKIGQDINGLLSPFAESLSKFDCKSWDHKYGFFVEDSDTSKAGNKKMSCELFKNIYTRRVSEGEDAELLIQTLNSLDGVDNDYLTKNLSTFIVPLGLGMFKGQAAIPDKGQSLKSYLERMEFADPWVLPQSRKGTSWANYGVLVMENKDSNYDRAKFDVFIMQDNHILGTYELMENTLLPRRLELPSALSKYTFDESENIVNSLLSSTWDGSGWLVQRLSSTLAKFDHVKMRKARLLMSDDWNMNERNEIISGKGVDYIAKKRAQESTTEED